MLNPEDSGGTSEKLSFAVIGPDGSPISPSSFRSADLDIAEILEKKYDTDESIPSDSEPQIFSTPKSNDLVSLRETYITMGIDNTVITVVEDTISSGSNLSGTGVIPESSY